MFGDKPTLDTSRFAITRKLYQAMGLYWHNFVDTSLLAFRALVKNHKPIAHFMSKMFAGLKDSRKVCSHIRQSLALDVDLDLACAKLRSALERAPTSYHTRLKNFVHGVAVATIT
mmetsp:Transcript_13706/g.19150  ORF Transcript_13706/g.19150 Transcript_13706/m.19150 type:complete len:115 (+) Transcript_13706:4103-4447(+)